jgi:thioredoxin reductase
VNARRLIVIGAGPIGIAAALGGVRRGWEVTVLESNEVGNALRRWGATRFFSPLGMNLPPGTREILGSQLPPDDAIVTGAEFADTVLLPLAQSEALAGRINTQHRVVAVGRSGLTRCDFPGHPIRGERPFRLLVDTPQGEKSFEAECVIDASGTYTQPVALGAGGIPAPGERALNGKFIRDLGSLRARLEGLRSRRILLIGHGHSTANAILVLRAIAEESSETHVTWATRSMNQRPCVEVFSDPLPERQQVVAQANQLASRPPGWLKLERRTSVENIGSQNGAFRVALGGRRVAIVDEIVALTGYRPDLSFLSELAIDIAPVTEGSARLARALSKVTDCLSVPSIAPGDLDSGEPGFYLAGAKSYGRLRTFLLKNGYAQLETMLDRIAASET